MRSRAIVRAAASMAALALVVSEGDAHAQGGGRSGAEQRRELLAHALSAANAGRHAEALDYVTRAGEIAMNSSVRRFQAQELEALGRFGEALDRANECLALGADEPQSGPRDQVLTDCRNRATSLTPRVGHVRLHLPASPPAGTEVHVAGVVIPQARWGEPLAVTPGAVPVEITAPQHQTFHQDVNTTAGQQAEVDVTLPEVTAQPAATASASTQTHPQPAHTHTARSPVGPIVAVVGVLGIAGGIVAHVLADGQYGSLRTACTTGASPCDSRANANAARSSIDTMDTVSEVALIAGGVLVAGGAALFLGLTHQEEDAATHARVRVIPGLGSLSVRVTF